jgi:hypothetical protein
MVTMKNGSTNDKNDDTKTLSNYLSKSIFDYNNNNNSINNKSNNNDLNELQRSLSKNSFDKSRIPSIKPVSTNRNSLFKISRNIKIIDDLDSSRIETLFDDDKLSNIQNVGKKLMDKIFNFADRYKGKFEVNPEDYTIQGLEKLREAMFDIIETYYDTFNKSVSLNNILKSYFLSYSENYRTINKKLNRLNELLETLSVKAEYSNNFYRDENKTIYNIIEIIRQEIKIYKNIFKLKYDKQSEDIYKKEHNTDKCNKISY